MSARKRHPCQCGCGGETGSRSRRWIEGHYTFRVRSENWQKKRLGAVLRRRAEMFAVELNRIGTRFTRQDLIAVFHDMYRRGYISGYLTGRKHKDRATAA